MKHGTQGSLLSFGGYIGSAPQPETVVKRGQTRIVLDHLFVCAASAALEAEQFVRFGLREAPSNRHPGQGTANRRLSFANAMIELLWVSEPEEAQSELARRTLLWERWSGRYCGASPFGICVRPADPKRTEPPFPAWEYRPPYLSDPLVMHIAETGVEEPMWVYLSFMRRLDREQCFVEHPIGIREITGLVHECRALRSIAAQRIINSGVLSNRLGEKTFLEIEFDGKRRKQTVDFRPRLPVKFQF